MKYLQRIIKMTAIAIAIAFIVYSCKTKLSVAEQINLKETPLQVVDSIFMLQSSNGKLKMRIEAPVMERYDNDTSSYELFPKGLAVYGYQDGELLESIILSDNARHYQSKKDSKEYWEAFGNVVIKNIIRRETIKTDTIYWDRAKQEIYTDCYVRMYSPKGFMQGYGLRSDDMARNSIIRHPFDSFGIVSKEETPIDSANFIGPILKR
ncbi:MAG: LPS export ABC transporter periplasmic protein LptC [Candidatus Cryptobacteroides sp.]